MGTVVYRRNMFEVEETGLNHGVVYLKDGQGDRTLGVSGTL